MKKLIPGFVFVAALNAACTLYAQVTPSIEWEKSFGGSVEDFSSSIHQTTDGGFIVAGFSESNDIDVSGNHGGRDYWIVKLDTAGNLVWQKSLGGSDNEQANSVQQTSDGGFIVAGSSFSDDGDVSGNHGGYYFGDYWILKLDASGDLIWQKCLGGSNDDVAKAIQQTTDGGFIVAGHSSSDDGDVSGNHGSYDYWIVKLDTGGNIVWQKSLGGSDGEEANDIQQTTDGGYIVAGYSLSNDGEVSGNHGELDYWIVKLDTVGNLVWQKSLGGSYFDYAHSVQQTTDGEFIIAGQSISNNGDVSGWHGCDMFSYGCNDYWIVKLDTGGNLLWQKTLGGYDEDVAYSVQQTTDDGFIIAGYSFSNNDDVSANHGSADAWIVKVDVNGNLLWQKCLGGIFNQGAFSIQQTSDSGFIIAAASESASGDVSENYGHDDYWIVKLSPDTPSGISSLSTNFVSLYPNPVHIQLYINLSAPANKAIIRVYDLQGRMIALPTTFTNTQVQLNTTSLPDGFYTLQISNKKTGEYEVGKFVKQE
ncbi:MAG TPA: T9SS type A sorting domain-containing protein [Chitinophagales bacterium]|nr:T9SS type A sorting domain-containing protein [Chitinophagales bacterium]